MPTPAEAIETETAPVAFTGNIVPDQKTGLLPSAVGTSGGLILLNTESDGPQLYMSLTSGKICTQKVVCLLDDNNNRLKFKPECPIEVCLFRGGEIE